MIAEERIAHAAQHEIPPYGVVLVDSGPAAGLLASGFPTDRELTVVTNSLEIATSLSAHTNLTLLLVGGRLDRRSLSTVDEWSLRVLVEIVVDVAFVCAEGISPTGGLTTADETAARVKRAMVACARRTVVLAAPGAVGVNRGAVFGTLADVDTVITSTAADLALAERIAAAGPRLVLA